MRSSFARIGLVTVLALGMVAVLPGAEAEARRGPRAGTMRGGHGGHGYPAAARHVRGPRRGPAVHRGWGGPRRGPVVRYRGAPRWHVYAPPPPPIYYPVPRVRVVVPAPAPVFVVPAPPVVVRPAPRVYRSVPVEPEPQDQYHEHFYDQPAPEGAPEQGDGPYDDGYQPYEDGQEGGAAPGDGWESPAPLPEEPEPHWGPQPTPAPTGPAAPPAGPGADVLTATELQRIEGEILGLVNAERTKRGLEPLAPEPRLGRAAAQHSGEMYSLDYFAHESPVEGNKSFTDRMGNAGVRDYGSAAENIVMAGNSPEVARRLVQLWLESPAHLENILRPEFRWTGVGVFGDGEKVYATQLFASDAE